MTFLGLTLKARWLGCQRIELPSCGSTNDEAARLARAGASHGTIVIAERQKSGRGRDGRTWESPPGGLYMSAVLRPPMPIVDVPPMTLAIGIGLCEAVRATGAPAVLKWPNDLLVDGRKLAGVLVEAQSQGNRLEAVIVGIGINLTGELPEPVAETGITLAEAAGTTIDREAFVERMLAHVERWVDRYVSVGIEPIIPAWTERMAVGLHARATIDGTPLTGCVAGLDADGALLLRDEDGNMHRVRSGDVEVLRALG
jgi:BirA family transcriptional regulator, biotin operon repressor / biotin---[acetyl-CoA-carboxylase] ligase